MINEMKKMKWKWNEIEYSVFEKEFKNKFKCIISKFLCCPSFTNHIFVPTEKYAEHASSWTYTTPIALTQKPSSHFLLTFARFLELLKVSFVHSSQNLSLVIPPLMYWDGASFQQTTCYVFLETRGKKN